MLFLFYLTFTSLFIPLFLSKVCSFFFSLFHSLQIKRSKSCTTKYWFVEPSVDRSARLSGYKRKADSSLIPPLNEKNNPWTMRFFLSLIFYYYLYSMRMGGGDIAVKLVTSYHHQHDHSTRHSCSMANALVVVAIVALTR